MHEIFEKEKKVTEEAGADMEKRGRGERKGERGNVIGKTGSMKRGFQVANWSVRFIKRERE